MDIEVKAPEAGNQPDPVMSMAEDPFDNGGVPIEGQAPQAEDKGGEVDQLKKQIEEMQAELAKARSFNDALKTNSEATKAMMEKLTAPPPQPDSLAVDQRNLQILSNALKKGLTEDDPEIKPRMAEITQAMIKLGAKIAVEEARREWDKKPTTTPDMDAKLEQFKLNQVAQSEKSFLSDNANRGNTMLIVSQLQSDPNWKRQGDAAIFQEAIDRVKKSREREEASGSFIGGMGGDAAPRMKGDMLISLSAEQKEFAHAMMPFLKPSEAEASFIRSYNAEVTMRKERMGLK